MSGNFFDDDGSPNELDPFTERQVGDRLRAALADHAERVEPAPNSYLTLSKRLDEEVPPAPKQSGRPSGRIFAAAAMFLLIAGAGTYAIVQGNTGDVNAIGGDETTIPATLPSTTLPQQEPTTTTVVTTTTTPPPEVVAAVVDRADLPASEDAETAAANFTHLLGLPGKALFTDEGDTVAVFSPQAVDPSFGPLARVSIEGDENGFVAVGAASETMQISEIFVDGDDLVVLGQGIAFEASVEVRLVASDGTPLATAYTTAGCCEDLAPFEARLPLRGQGEAFVVAHGDNAGSGVVPPFAAQPISYDAPSDGATYTVFRIRPDDSDRGLNLRDLPGTDEGQVLATLPPGETGIRRLPVMPALVGDSFWWNVETADGTRGWVHSSFLTPDSTGIGDGEMIAAAQAAIGSITAAEYGLDGIALSRRVPVALGWIAQPEAVYGPELLDESVWIEAGTWAVPEATYGEPEKVISLRSLLNLPDNFDEAPLIELGANTPFGIEQDMVSSYFAGTRAVTVIGPEADDEPARSALLFFEATPAGPQLVGAVASIWVP